MALQVALAFDPPERQVAAMNHPATDETAIEELARIWKSLDRERMKPLVNVYPLEPKLKLGEDSLKFGNKEDLTRYLAEIQPTIVEMIHVAARIPEQFGPPPSDSDDNSNAHMEHPRAWIQNFERLLSADASWKWENAEADAAADRIGAVFRFSQWLFVQREDSNSPVLAVGLFVRNSRHLNAMLDDGMEKALSSDAKSRLQSAMSEIDASDLGGLLRGWEDAAQNSVRWFRQEFLGEDGAKRYAEYLRTYGVFAGAVSDLSRFDAKAAEVWREIQGLVPEKDFAEKASGLTKEQLSAAIDEAEMLVSPLAVAIRAENIDSVRTLSKKIASDQTQVARCVIGPVVPTLQLSQAARAALAESKRRISESVK